MAENIADFMLRLRVQVENARALKSIGGELRAAAKLTKQQATVDKDAGRRIRDRLTALKTGSVVLKKFQADQTKAAERTAKEQSKAAKAATAQRKREMADHRRNIAAKQRGARITERELDRFQGRRGGGSGGGRRGSGRGGGRDIGGGGLDVFRGTLLGNLAANAISGIAGLAVSAVAKVADLGASFVGATFSAVDLGQRSKTALTSILKDGNLAAQQFQQVRMEAGQLGLDVPDALKSFTMLANANFSVPMARDLVRMSADLQALTGSSESAQFALRAISQIKMKGRLQAEELTGQLAEHGISADEVYRVLGKTLGKTRDEILKMQKAGDLSADVAIPAILQAVQNQLGVDKSGGFAEKLASSSIGGMLRVLKAQAQNMFITLGESVGPGITNALQSIMASIQEAVMSPEAAALGQSVVELFNAASAFAGGTDLKTLLTSAATVLGEELGKAAVFIRDHGAELRDNFILFATAMGQTLIAAINFMKPLVDFMASDFGKFMFTPLSETFGSDAREKKKLGGGLAQITQRPLSPANTLGALGASGPRTTGPITINNTINGTDLTNPQVVSDAIGPATERALLRALGDLD